MYEGKNIRALITTLSLGLLALLVSAPAMAARVATKVVIVKVEQVVHAPAPEPTESPDEESAGDEGEGDEESQAQRPESPNTKHFFVRIRAQLREAYGARRGAEGQSIDCLVGYPRPFSNEGTEVTGARGFAEFEVEVLPTDRWIKVAYPGDEVRRPNEAKILNPIYVAPTRR